MDFRRFLLFCGLLIVISAQADTIELSGRFTQLQGNMPPTVSLHPYTGQVADVNASVVNGRFKIKVPLSGAMLYNLRFLYSSYDIMLSSAEKMPSVLIEMSGDHVTNMKVESRESESYTPFQGIVNTYDDKLHKHFADCEKEDGCSEELSKILTDYRSELQSLQAKYKGTYTAETLCKEKMPVVAKDVKKTAADFRAGYFEKVAFTDKNILDNPVYKEMIEAYVDFLIEPKLSKEDAFIKDLMTKSKADPKVYSQTAGFLYEALYRKSREKMLGMFITYYNENKDAINNPVVDQKVKNMMRSMPGGQYLDIVRKDVAGHTTALREVVDKSKCTLLLFWSSECSHCREEMPQVKEAYAKYHDKGLNIYAVSLEPTQDKWKDYIKENNLTWTNVKNLEDNSNNPAVEYMIAATPTLILIDNKGVIVHRFTPKNKLDKYIQEVLK